MTTVLGNLRTVEFGTRFAARFMDGLIILAFTVFLALMGDSVLPEEGWFRWPWEHSKAARSLLAGVYEAGFLMAAAATPGKRAMSIEVVDVNSGQPVGPVAAVVRTAVFMGAGWVPGVGFIVGLALVLPILWTGFGVHDWIARTWVVTRVDESPELTSRPDQPA